MIQRFKIRFLNYCLRHLFPIVNPEKVFMTDKKGNSYLNGELVDAKKLAGLKSEVLLLRNSLLWEIMTNTLKHQAQEVMWKNSKDFQDVLNGKMMLYNIGVQEQIIKTIENS